MPTTTPTAQIPKTESAPSASNLKIFDFKITELTYRSAVVSWKTSQPATSKANYGYSIDNMPNEVAGKEKTTTHKLVLQGETIRAGNHYGVRITSDDGAGPVTLDAEFSTKGIDIIIKVTNPQEQSVAGALISTDTTEITTTEDGTAVLTVPEGDVAISAKKDDLSADLIAEIFIPESEDALPQQVAIVLSPSSGTSSDAPAKSDQGSLWWILLLPLVGGTGFMAFVLLVRRKRRRAARNVPHVTIETDFTGGGPNRYPTLPELVTQDLSKHRKPTSLEEEPEDMYTAAKHASYGLPHTAQPVEHHAPAPQPKAPDSPPPIHHVQKTDTPPKSHTPEHKPSHPKPHHIEAEIDPKDNSLHINHDD
jgi:hypothetical protein